MLRSTQLPFAFLLLWLLSCTRVAEQQQTEPEQSSEKRLVDYVDPKIGVIDNRENNCVIGPQLPFGSINPSPQTQNGEHDGYDPKEPIRGFGQLHVSGTGWGKYGQFLISPQTGLSVGPKSHDSPKSAENARADYYGVTLDRYNIKVELTPTHNAAIYRLTFPKSDSATVLIDVTHSLTLDIVPRIGGHVRDCKVAFDPKNPSVIYGGGFYKGGFGDGEYPLYFAAELSKQPIYHGTWTNEEITTNNKAVNQSSMDDKIGTYVGFQTEDNEEIYLKIAISFTSSERAKQFLDSEIPAWDFEKAQTQAFQKWENQLSKITLEGGTEEQLIMFYTALHRSMLMPRDRSDDNRLWKNSDHYWDDHFAVWDTWRTVFPLMTILNPERVADNINAFIERFDNIGEVRDTFIAGIDMYADQGGNNVDNVIADAMVKGIQGFDYEKAYEILKLNADTERNGWQGFGRAETIKESSYKKNGWIPADKMSCSYTLEYNYNDYCIAQAAKLLGKEDDYQKYLARSNGWQQLWNPALESDGFTGFIGPKTLNGKWIDINTVKKWGSWNEYFYEANSWTYSFFMPHDFQKLIELSGGKEEFVKRAEYALQKGYIVSYNEPAFTVAHSFSYAGRPDLTSKWIRHTMNTGYDLTGYPGNDDSGAMSSWYVFSALGIFPIAGQETYVLNSPLFSKATIRLSNGKKIIISAPEASEKNIYIKSCKLNGKLLDDFFIRHEDISDGADIVFELSDKP